MIVKFLSAITRLVRPLSAWYVRAPFLAVLASLFLYWAYYSLSIKVEHSVFGDMVGKWIQVQSILQNPKDPLACAHPTEADPKFEFLPGPHYFYFVEQGRCRYQYPYTYAYLVAPFVAVGGVRGHLAMNLAWWLLFAAALVMLARRVFPEEPRLAPVIGLASFLFLPSGVFAFDFSEMMVATGLGALALALVASHSEDRSTNALLLSGVLIGLSAAFRTEAIVFGAFLGMALLVDEYLARKDDRSYGALLRTAFWFGLGILLATLPVAIVRFALFDHPLGLRARLLADAVPLARLQIIRVMLFGGPLGLVTSLPFCLLTALLVASRFRGSHGRAALFHVIVAFGTIVTLLGITPADPGYSWSPRYLALALPSLLVLFVIVLQSLRGQSDWPARFVQAAAVVLVLYGVAFVYLGMRTVRIATKQTQRIQKVIGGLLPENGLIIIGGGQHYTALSTKQLRHRILQCDTRAKFLRCMQLLDAAGSKEVLLIEPSPAYRKQFLPGSPEMIGEPPPVWKEQERGEFEGTILVVYRKQ